jgi:hypothetical protein
MVTRSLVHFLTRPPVPGSAPQCQPAWPRVIGLPAPPPPVPGSAIPLRSAESLAHLLTRRASGRAPERHPPATLPCHQLTPADGPRIARSRRKSPRVRGTNRPFCPPAMAFRRPSSPAAYPAPHKLAGRGGSLQRQRFPSRPTGQPANPNGWPKRQGYLAFFARCAPKGSTCQRANEGGGTACHSLASSVTGEKGVRNRFLSSGNGSAHPAPDDRRPLRR